MNTPVNFELAKLLKEKGFNTPTNRYYEHALTSQIDSETNEESGPFGWKKGETHLRAGFMINNYGMADLSNENWYMCSAPTVAEIVMWLYEKHGIWIEIIETDLFNKFFFQIKRKDNTRLKDGDYNSPTEAYEKGIEYVLGNII